MKTVTVVTTLLVVLFVAVPAAVITDVTIEDASSEYNSSRPAENIINGAGFDETNGYHSAASGNYINWNNTGTVIEPNDPLPSYVTVNLEANYNLESVKIWNWNTATTLDAGSKDVEILVASGEGRPFTSLGSFVFDKAPGLDNIDFGQIIDVSGFSAADDVRLVQFNILTNYGLGNNLAGLSEVRFYGSVVSNSLGSGTIYSGFNRIEPGLFKFTDLTDLDGTKTKVGGWPFPEANWQCSAFDGNRYLIFGRSQTSYGNPALYSYDGDSSLVPISGSYTFMDWHGIAEHNGEYYGLYHGSNLSGPGLYRFTDPADPENTAMRMFPTQTFNSNVWQDVAYDGATFWFVRSAAGGTPGIYAYAYDEDDFYLVSSGETYTNWGGARSVYQID
jgi:hypothetical protein